MPAGSVVAELLAKTGSFDTDIERSTKAAEKRMKAMQKTAEEAGIGIGLAMGAVTAGVIAMAASTISGLDKLADVADATGASVEKLSALEDIALRTGNSFESVSTALIKLNQQLKDTDPNNKTSQILKTIGLDANQLRQIDPAEALHQVALGLAQFADDGDKARVVQELFGKSVAEVGPLLKDLAEQQQLHATVTAESVKASKDFTKQLADMHKNTEDLARSLASELLPAINEVLKAWRQGGPLAGLQAALTGTDLHKAQQDIVGLTDSILTVQNTIDAANAKQKSGGVGGWLAGLNLPGYEKKLADLKGQLQSAQALVAVSEPGFFAGPAADKPGIGPVPQRIKKQSTGKDPDADFNQYMKHLEQMNQKLGEFTEVEKLADDLAHGILTFTPAQEEAARKLAANIDAHKEWNLQMKEGRQRAIEEGDAINKAAEEFQKWMVNVRMEFRQVSSAAGDKVISDAEEYQRRLAELRDQSPTGQLVRQKKDADFLSESMRIGDITANEYYRQLDQITGKTDELTKLSDDFSSIGGDALHSLVIEGASLNDVFKGVLKSLADMILKIGVLEPLAKQMRAAFTGGGGFGDFLSKLLGVGAGVGDSIGVPANPDFMGPLMPMAEGGDVMAGREYMVGERGPERFVPRTAGMIVPNQAAGAGGSGWTLVNHGRPAEIARVDPREKVLWLQDARRMMAADLRNPSSRLADAAAAGLNVRKRR